MRAKLRTREAERRRRWATKSAQVFDLQGGDQGPEALEEVRRLLQASQGAGRVTVWPAALCERPDPSERGEQRRTGNNFWYGTYHKGG